MFDRSVQQLYDILLHHRDIRTICVE